MYPEHVKRFSRHFTCLHSFEYEEICFKSLEKHQCIHTSNYIHIYKFINKLLDIMAYLIS